MATDTKIHPDTATLMRASDRLLFELEDCNLIGLRQPPPELRLRCMTLLATTVSREEVAHARNDDVTSLQDRLFAMQHELMRSRRSPEFKDLPNDHD